jgi:O-succinylbenzoate synthase
MRVTSVDLLRVTLPLVHAFRTSSHGKNSLEHILVKLTDADGRQSWGEIASPAAPYYSGETTDTCWLMAERYLAPMLLALDWEHPREVSAALAKVRGNGFAKAGLDAAVWTLFAQAHGIPLAAALGGTRTSVESGVSLGIEDTVDALLEQVALQVDHGYHRVKLKIAPGWDVDPVREVRDAFPDIALQVDANGAYRPELDHLRALVALDDLGLQMIEQPFAPRALIAHATLQQRIETPLCLDESIDTVEDVETALRLDAGRIVNIKVSRMGGLTAAVAAHDLAREVGVPVWCGGMHEFGVGRAVNVAIASLPGFTLTSDVSGSDKYYARDVTTRPIVAVDGMVEVPTGVGLGFEVDDAWVAENTVRSAQVLAG